MREDFGENFKSTFSPYVDRARTAACRTESGRVGGSGCDGRRRGERGKKRGGASTLENAGFVRIAASRRAVDVDVKLRASVASQHAFIIQAAQDRYSTKCFLRARRSVQLHSGRSRRPSTVLVRHRRPPPRPRPPLRRPPSSSPSFLAHHFGLSPACDASRIAGTPVVPGNRRRAELATPQEVTMRARDVAQLDRRFAQRPSP